MEDFNSFPKDVPGAPGSLMRSRRQLKRVVAERREEEAAHIDADRMGNPVALSVLATGSVHGTQLRRFSTAAEGRESDRRGWEEDRVFQSRAGELKHSRSLMVKAEGLYQDTAHESNAFLGTRHPNDKRVQAFEDVRRCGDPVKCRTCRLAMCVVANYCECSACVPLFACGLTVPVTVL